MRARTGADLRALGTGTAGARNTGRVLGRGGFVLALLGDALKGAAAVALARWLAPASPAGALAALAVVAGHVHPVQLGFRGGKGLASAFGAVLVLAPVVAAVTIGVTLIWIAATRRGVEAALVGVTALPLAMAMLRPPGIETLAILLLSVLILHRHASVIRQLVTARG